MLLFYSSPLMFYCDLYFKSLPITDVHVKRSSVKRLGFFSSVSFILPTDILYFYMYIRIDFFLKKSETKHVSS